MSRPKKIQDTVKGSASEADFEHTKARKNKKRGRMRCPDNQKSATKKGNVGCMDKKPSDKEGQEKKRPSSEPSEGPSSKPTGGNRALARQTNRIQSKLQLKARGPTNIGLTSIGRALGKREPQKVTAGVKKVEEELEEELSRRTLLGALNLCVVAAPKKKDVVKVLKMSPQAHAFGGG